MADALKDPKVRVQLDLSAKQAERFDSLVKYCDLGSRKELFNVAMSLFYWATQEASKGRKVASYDEKKDHVETIIVPALENICLQLAKEDSKMPINSTTSRKDRVALGGAHNGGNHVFAVK